MMRIAFPSAKIIQAGNQETVSPPPKSYKQEIGWLFLILVDNQLAAAALDFQSSCRRILDAHNITLDCPVDRGILEQEVCIAAEGAVFEHKPVNVTQQLLACEMASDKADVLPIPCQILSVYLAIIHRDVLRFPQRIL